VVRPRPCRTTVEAFNPSSETDQAVTVAGQTPTSSKILVFANPSAAINNARAR
jgi:hypothetical protein